MNKLNKIQAEINYIHQIRQEIMEAFRMPIRFFKSKKAGGQLFVKPIKKDEK